MLPGSSLGNGYWDAEEVYIDSNGNGNYDPGEEYDDENNNDENDNNGVFTNYFSNIRVFYPN